MKSIWKYGIAALCGCLLTVGVISLLGEKDSNTGGSATSQESFEESESKSEVFSETSEEESASESEFSSESETSEESSVEEHTHDYTVTTTEPTCMEKGVKTYVCGCGDSYTEEIPATDEHTDDGNGICTVCGYPTAPTEGVIYEIIDGTAVVTGYEGTAEKVRIADTYEGVAVTSIGEWAFAYCDLTSVVIPDSVTSIDFAAFCGCESLTSIVIPNSVTSIGARAFQRCSSLTSVVIGDSVTSIGNSVFYECRSLTSVVIGDSVTSIGNSAFIWCESLTSIIVAENNEKYKDIDGNLYGKDGTILIQYAIGKTASSFTIPDSVTSIGDEAFWYCSSLTSVVIPDSVTSIGDYAFYNCSSLTSLVIGNSVTSIGDYAFSYCRSLTSVVIGDSVTSIGEDAFYDCTSLTSVVIGDSVTSIGEDAFFSCYKLVEVVNKSENITVEKESSNNGYLGYYALAVYNSDSGVTESQLLNDNGYIVYIDGEEKILVGYNATETDLVLPSYITKINQFAFATGCTTTVVDSMTEFVCDSPICNRLKSIVIPDSVTSIGSCAFSNCHSLTSVVIPDSVTSIGGGAFNGCYSLTSVVIGDSVESIATGAFSGCNSLTSVVIGNSVTSIGAGAFSNRHSLASVYYKGTAEDWAEISIRIGNLLSSERLYYYSETQPTEEGNYWHYDENGEIVVW